MPATPESSYIQPLVVLEATEYEYPGRCMRLDDLMQCCKTYLPPISILQVKRNIEDSGSLLNHVTTPPSD